LVKKKVGFERKKKAGFIKKKIVKLLHLGKVLSDVKSHAFTSVEMLHQM
jgi:hypothetical protein